MKLLALLVLSGCWQMTVYTGPRVDSSGHLAWEAGASFGAAASGPNHRALALSLDTSAPVPRPDAPCPSSGCARRTASAPDELPSRGAVRGVLEWIGRPRLGEADLGFAHGVGWRAGVYGGLDIRADGNTLGMIGGIATVSPWVWGSDTATNWQSIALGVQFATELTPLDGRVVGRVALACDAHFLPRRW